MENIAKGQYTFDKNHDGVIQHHLDTIIEVLVREENPISIILFGGFGKGEGTMLEQQGKVQPFNDYDLYMISDYTIAEERLRELMLMTSRAIGKGGLDYVEHAGNNYDSNRFFHVDVRAIKWRDLDKLYPTQRTYELKYSSQVIYGDPQVIDLVRPIGKSEIPISEGIRNIFNKFDTSLLCYDDKYFSSNGFSTDHKGMIVYYAAKSFLSSLEALLILTGDYEGRYTERIARFIELAEEKYRNILDIIPDYIDRLNWAMDIKRGQMDLYKGNITDLWTSSVRTTGIILKYIIEQIYSCMGLDYFQMAELIYNDLPKIYFNAYLKQILKRYNIFFPTKFFIFSQYVFNLKYFNMLRRKDINSLRPLFDWRDVGIRLAVPLILLTLSYIEKEKEKYITCSQSYLSKIIGKKFIQQQNLDEYKKQVLDCYGCYYMQKTI